MIANKVSFLGTGGAFDYEYGNSSAIIRLNGFNYLVDCGHSVYEKLRETGLIEQIDFVLITHMHADHIGSLSTLLLYHDHFVEDKQLQILYPDVDFRDKLMGYLRYSLQTPEKYVAFSSIEKQMGVGYVDTSDLHVKGMRSFAYYFEDEEGLIAYSGDLGDADHLIENLDHLPAKNRVLFHEVCFDPKLEPHTFHEDLYPYLSRYKIYGYHCRPEDAPDDSRIPLVYNEKSLMT